MDATTGAAVGESGSGERAGDWHLDEMLLTAMGFGDLGRSEGAASEERGAGKGSAASAADSAAGDLERQGAALAAAAADREAHARDPVVQYLKIHSTTLSREVGAMLREHREEWPAPGTELSWANPARFTQQMMVSLCAVVRNDPFALFRLVHPLSPDDAYRRHVDGAHATRRTWIPGFGEAVAAQVKAAMFSSIERIGARFQAAAAAGNGESPELAQIVTSHPLDSYVRKAMAGDGVLDFSTVSRPMPAKAVPAGGAKEGASRGAKGGKRDEGAAEDRGGGSDASPLEGRAGGGEKAAALRLQWLGREDPTLWNYVRVAPASATAEEVAAALYGHPAQSRMAFALQKHGDLFQVAPKEARALIASRYPGEVTGRGTARDGAALARSRLGDVISLREVGAAASQSSSSSAAAAPAAASTTKEAGRAGRSASTSAVTSAASRREGESDEKLPLLAEDAAKPASLPQLLELHFSILSELEKLRSTVAPFGLGNRLEPAFAFRARTMLAANQADAAELQQWREVWHAQHVHLMMITAAAAPLAAQLQATTPAPLTPARIAALRARLGKYLAAAVASHLKESCAALLAELAAEREQEVLDQATDTQIGLHEAVRQAKATPGQGTLRGSEEADAALTRAQARVLRGGDPAQLQEAQLGAEEAALRIRLETVRLSLIELSSAADEAGHGLSSEIASHCSGKFRSLPALIDAVQLRLHDVERTWAGAERDASTFDVVADEREEGLRKLEARAKGLEAASQAFAKISGDQDIGTFLREAQGVVSSQQFRSGIVKLAGALVITVVTSGLAAELGAGLAGLVGAGEAGGALTAGALAARAGGAVVNLAVNITVNSALQYAMSEGHDSMGWALVENALMELGTRGLARTLKGPMSHLHRLELEALRDGRRLRELASIERTAARRGAALSDSLAQEREALHAAREARSGWFVTQLTVEMVMGMASQWAARSLVRAMQEPKAHVSDDFASNVLQQGAAIMLGKKLFGLKAAWHARRLELEAKPWFAKLPEARTLVEGRTVFFGDANRLAHSLSPELTAGPELLARHEELVRLEQELVARGQDANASSSDVHPSRGLETDALPHASADAASDASSPGSHEGADQRIEGPGTPRASEARQRQPNDAASDSHGKPRAPIHLLGDDMRALAAAHRLSPLPGHVDVFIHATADRLMVKRLGGDAELTPRQFAAYLRRQGLEGMKIRLVGCSTGAHPDAVAQRLADALGSEVLAPSEDVWIGPNGEHGIGPRAGVHRGTWRPFKPRTSDPTPPETPREPTPFERERMTREREYDVEAPEAVYAPRGDLRARMASASAEDVAAAQQALRVPVVVDPTLVDGVRILARRVPRLIGFDLVVHEVRVGSDALLADVHAHTSTIAAVEKYNGVVANLRELRQRLQRSASRWFGRGQASNPSTADTAVRTVRGEGAAGIPLEEQPFHYPRGSRGWVTEVELRKLHSLLEARKTPLHQGEVDYTTLHEENAFLEGRRLLHEEVLRSMDETSVHASAESELSLERPDTGEVTREALSKGYRLPGPEEGARPEWYYYRSSTSLAGQYELVRRPTCPNSAPGFRARVVGDTFTGLEPLGAAGGIEIPHTLSARQVVEHLRETPGFGQYLEMLETQGVASKAMVDGVIQHKFNLLGMSGKRVTTEALRGDVRDHFRERVTERLCDPSLSGPASWQRFREMTAKLSPTERGNLAEIWYRHRHTKGAKGQTRVDVPRTSGLDEGKIQRRVVDAVEGDTAIEVKDVVGPIDQDQFGAYLDMLQTLGAENAPMFRKVKYVFTKPEGAIENLEFLGDQIEARGLEGVFAIEVFDSQGVRKIARSRKEAMALKHHLQGLLTKEASRE